MAVYSPLAQIVPAVFLVLGLCACKPKPTPPPYADADAPDPAALLAGASPALTAVAVPHAKVKLGAHRGNLAFLAESPHRFRGSVTIAGNEVVSLSVHEQGYHLVYKLDALAPGYYEGPPSACAVSALLGVGLDGPKLVALVLGGAPIIDNFQVVSQRWDERRGRELLWLRNNRYHQELAFRYDGTTWRFAEATLHEAGASGPEKRLWTVAHQEFADFDGATLPRLTKLSRPGKRRDEVVTIELKEVDTTPSWATKTTADTAGDTDGAVDPPGDTDGNDPTAGEDTGWDDGGEWEGEDGETPPPPAEPVPAPTPTAKPTAATQPTAPPVPPRWKLTPGSLVRRGDLCRGQRP